MYKLCFFVPPSHLEIVKDALFAEGAGRFGNYDHCCWQTLGEGQFRPLVGSTPYLGQENQLEKLAEFKVEMVCQANYIGAVIERLLTVHPYQQPAYEVYPILTKADLPIRKAQ